MSWNTNTDILLAGASAAFTVDLLLYPVDTIKTRIQSPDYKKLYTNPTTNAVNRSLFRGMYQGIGSVVIATVPASGAFFTVYERTKTLLHDINPTSTSTHAALIPTPVIHFAASSIGELVSCCILTPAEVLKQNAQMIKKSSSSTSTTTKSISSNATIQALKKFNKPSQLWRGYGALAARNLPFTAMQFPMFEYLKKSISTSRERNHTSSGSLLEKTTITAISASIAGSIAAVITTPIDVVKTRIMLSASSSPPSDPSSSSANPQAQAQAIKQLESLGKNAKAEIERANQAARSGRAGGIAIGREVFRTEGIRGLFQGGALRGIWTAVGAALYLGAYESTRNYLATSRKEREGDEGQVIT